MLTLATPTGPLCFYDDIRQLSAARWQRFSAKYLEYSIGTNLFAVDGHISRLALFLGQRNMTGASEQFNHLVTSLNHIRQGVNGEAVVLACLLASIGEEVCDDVSDSGLLITAERITGTGVSQHRLVKTLERAKKRLSGNSH